MNEITIVRLGLFKNGSHHILLSDPSRVGQYAVNMDTTLGEEMRVDYDGDSLLIDPEEYQKFVEWCGEYGEEVDSL